MFLASALSFDAILAAIPLALLFLATLGYMFDVRADTVGDIQAVLRLLLPSQGPGADESLARAERLITAVVASRREFSLYGLPLYLLFSTRLFASARIALNKVLNVPTRHRFFYDLSRDLLLVIFTTVLFAANSLVVIPVFGFSLVDRIVSHALAIAFGTVLFFVVYSVGSDKTLRWDTALLAGFVASVAFEVSKILYGAYLAEFATVNRAISHANAIAVLLFVLWIYYTALIFLLCGEVAKSHEAHHRDETST